MRMILKRDWEALDASGSGRGEDIIIPKGEHEVERVPNPFGYEGFWLVLKGTRIGASEESWRQWRNGVLADNPTHQNFGKPIDWGEYAVEIIDEDTIQVWRNDGLSPPDAFATIGTIVRRAEDAIRSESIFTFFIVHVDSFHGKGFMPSVRSTPSSGSMHNGDVFRGTSEKEYAAARAAGERMLEKAVDELDRSMEETHTRDPDESRRS